MPEERPGDVVVLIRKAAGSRRVLAQVAGVSENAAVDWEKKDAAPNSIVWGRVRERWPELAERWMHALLTKAAAEAAESLRGLGERRP